MNCPQCQMAIPQGAQFCTYCGFPIAQSLAGGVPAPGPAGAPGSQPPGATPPTYQTAPPAQPMYAPPPSQPVYPGMQSQPIYPPPPQPVYAPPSQPMYAPPSQPMYAPPPSQPMQPPYAAPGSMPLQATGPAPVSSRLAEMLRSAPPTAAPTNAVQGFMRRNISPTVSTNTWFMAAIGALVALVSGLILSAIAEALWSSALDQALAAYATSATNLLATGLVKSVLTPDLLKFFLFEQHVPFTIHADISANNVGGGGDLGIGFPLTGLIIIPGIALALGGYISSASDFTHNTRSSLLRGALIGPFYGIILAIIALISTSSTSASLLGESVGFSLSAAPIPAFLYGILWGAIFGALGGWIQFSGRRAISGMLPTLRATGSRWLGAGVGGVVAIVAGVLLTCAVTAGLYPLALTLQSGNTTSGTTSTLSGSNALLVVLVLFAFLPTVGSALFTIIAGAPYVTSTAQASLLGASGAAQSPAPSSVGLIGAQSHPAFGPVYLALLIPIIAYLIGGRISARIAGADRREAALVSGALIGIPCSLLMAFMAYLLSFNLDVSALGLVSASEGAAPSIFGAFLAGLIGGAVFGALGGMSEIAMPRLGDVAHVLLVPLRPLALVVDPLLDAITGHPRGQVRSAARRWLYDAVLLATVLVILIIILNIVNALPVAAVPFKLALTLDAILATAVVALPLLYLTGALLTLFSAPLDTMPLASNPIPTAPAMPVAQPMSYPMAPAMSQPLTGGPMPGMPTGQYPTYPGAAMGAYPGAPPYPPYPPYPGAPSVPMAPAAPVAPIAPAPPAYPPGTTLQQPDATGNPGDGTGAQ